MAEDAAVFGLKFPIDYIIVASGDTEEDHRRMVLRGFHNARAAHLIHSLGHGAKERLFVPVMGIYVTEDFMAYRYLFATVLGPDLTDINTTLREAGEPQLVQMTLAVRHVTQVLKCLTLT